MVTHNLREQKQQAFHEKVVGCYEKAAQRCGVIDYHYRIAGTRVQLSFAGPALVAETTPALAHLRIDEPAEEPEFKVLIWDSASTGVPMVQPPCSQRNLTHRGDIWGFDSERYKSAFRYGEFSVNLMDTEENVAVFWIRDVENLPFWVTASPLRGIFHWWMEKNGMQLIHGAGVGTEAGAAVLTARGGSGKSTTALLCLEQGMKYVADDYLIVELDPEPRLHSLYCTAKLDPDQVKRFPSLAELAHRKEAMGYDKSVFYLHEAFPDQVCSSLPWKSVLVPSISGENGSQLLPIDALSVEQAVSFTTISHLPHAGQQTVDVLRRFSREVPRFELSLGRNLWEIPSIVESSLASPGAAALEEESVNDAAIGRSDDPPLPLLSVVIPVYNGADFVEEAVANVLAQDYPRVELILVNDGSQDNSREIIERLPQDLCYYEFKTNLGPAEARNRGVREAAGDYIAFLDVDDLWPASNLKRLMKILLEHPAVDIVQGRAQVVQYDRERNETVELEYREEDRFPFYLGTALYRRSVFHRVGRFDPELRFGEDSDWFLRAKEMGVQILPVDGVSLQVRRHDRNMTRAKSPKELNALRVFKKRLDRHRARTGSPDRSETAAVRS